MSSKKSQTYILAAIEQANLSPMQSKHGCVIVSGGKIVSTGYNTFYKKNYLVPKSLSVHAEMSALFELFYQKKRKKGDIDSS